MEEWKLMENLKIEPTINKFDVRVGKKKDTKYNTDIKITARSEIRMEELYNLAAKGIMKSPNLTMFPITESRTVITPEKEKKTTPTRIDILRDIGEDTDEEEDADDERETDEEGEANNGNTDKGQKVTEKNKSGDVNTGKTGEDTDTTGEKMDTITEETPNEVAGEVLQDKDKEGQQNETGNGNTTITDKNKDETNSREPMGRAWADPRIAKERNEELQRREKEAAEKALTEKTDNTDKDVAEPNTGPLTLDTEISLQTATPVHSDEHNIGGGEKTEDQEEGNTKGHEEESEAETITGDDQIEGVEEAIEVTDTPARKEQNNVQPVISTEETAKILQIRRGQSQLPVLGKPTIPRQIEKQKASDISDEEEITTDGTRNEGKRARHSSGKADEDKLKKKVKPLENSVKKPNSTQLKLEILRENKLKTKLALMTEGKSVHSATESDNESYTIKPGNRTEDELKKKELETEERLKRIMTKELKEKLEKRLTKHEMACMAAAGHNARVTMDLYLNREKTMIKLTNFGWKDGTEKKKYTWKKELTEEAKKAINDKRQSLANIGGGVTRWIDWIKRIKIEMTTLDKDYTVEKLIHDLQITKT